ncbi:MAG: hypothetical protein M3Y46_02640, partial [Actinomycetota bacterium]|nr:hypothetical protein [Actinomycetota bacterium]
MVHTGRDARRPRRAHRRAGRSTAAMAAVIAVVASLLMPLTAPAAWAGAGSSISGTVWRDKSRDGVVDADEVPAGSVAVQLVASATNTVVATTITDAAGNYRFADLADNTYYVRVVAPNGMIFPATAAGENDFHRESVPATGQPETGITAPVTIQGANTFDLDAGMWPIPNLSIEKAILADACDGYAQTGTAPWDPQDGPGLDAGSANCVVRTGDDVVQQFTISANPLPTGAVVPNVVAQFDVTTPDGADLELTGTGAGGLPDGCLTADLGANPPSTVTALPGGGFRITCNVGSMTNQNAILQVSYRFTTTTPVPAHAEITARVYAPGGEAADSNVVSGPVVEVTALAEWDLSKTLLTAPSAITWDGVPGFFVDYDITLTDTSGGVGGAELVWPVEFTDRMTSFPGALLVSCRRKTEVTNSNWDIGCPEVSTAGNHVPQGVDGWSMTFSPRSDEAVEQGSGVAVVRVFVPRDEAYRAIDPDWTVGDPLPEGDLDWQNQLIETDGWSMNGGQPNFGDGLEPGWDGEQASGNNVVDHTLPLTTPGIDVSKGRDQGPSYTTRVIDGVTVPGYTIRYRYYISITDPNLLARWVDAPVTITDVLTYQRAGDSTWHTDAHLIGCTSHISPGTSFQRGAVICSDVGEGGEDGWQVSYQ